MSGVEGDDEAPKPVDDLEHWLHDVRSELGNDPPGWLAPDSQTADVEAEPPPPARPSQPGRHRSRD